MKHEHSDINVKVDIPKEDVEDVIDKVTESVLIVIAAYTVAHIVKKYI